MTHAVVFVLGPWAQSPRMRNHADELLARGYGISLVAYGIPNKPTDGKDTTNCGLDPVQSTGFPGIIDLVFKVIILTVRSVLSLSRIPEFPKIVIAQV